MTYVYDDVTYVFTEGVPINNTLSLYDDVTDVYDDVTYVFTEGVPINNTLSLGGALSRLAMTMKKKLQKKK